MYALTAQLLWRLYTLLGVVTVYSVPDAIPNDGVLRMITVFVPSQDEDAHGFAVAAEGR